MRRSLNKSLKLLSHSPSVKGRPAASHLCQSCQNLIITKDLIKGIPESFTPDGNVALDLIQGYIDLPMKMKDHSPGFDHLKQRATSCQFCAALCEAIKQDIALFKGQWDKQRAYGDVEIKFRYSCTATLGVVSFAAGQWPTILSALEAVVRRRDDAKDSHEPIIIVFKVYSESSSNLSNYLRIRRRLIDQSPLSKRNLELMKCWIQECRDNHFICSPLGNTSVPARPTRLVFVGDRRDGTLPRLALSENLPENVRYAALSYCWGAASSMRLTTTSDTLESLLGGISWDKIPSAFNDAFLMARLLGFRYVWIDALCIVQDDSNDWQVEAAKMGDIYRGAQITLVAAASTSTNEGFLSRSSDPGKSVPVPYDSPVHKSIVGDYHLLASAQGYKEDFGRDVEQSIWNERGWTFQERQLSRRILFFGKHSTYFECRVHRRVEGYEDPINRSLAFYKHMQNTSEWKVLHMSWRKLVEEFSSRKFTYDKDRLPAFAGLAKEIVLKTTEEEDEQHDELAYFAGHWKRSLEIDLPWVPEFSHGDTKSLQDSLPQAPPQNTTWTWCKYPRKVSWMDPGMSAEQQPMCTAKVIPTGAENPNVLGNSTDSHLEIQGPLAAMDIPIIASKNRTSWRSIPIGVAYSYSGPKGDGYVPLYHFQYKFDNGAWGGDSVWLAWTSDVSNPETICHDGIVLKAKPGQEYTVSGEVRVMKWAFWRVGVFRVQSGERQDGFMTSNDDHQRNWQARHGFFKYTFGFEICRYRVF